MGKYLDKEGVSKLWNKSKKTFAELPKSEGDTEELDYGYAVLVNKETGNKIKVKPENLKNYDTDKYTPIGVIVVPTSHDVYGTGECAMVSLNAMRYDTPDTGGDNQTMYWGYNSKLLGTAYTQVPILDSYSSDSPVITKTATTGYMPSDKFSGFISGQDEKASYKDSYLSIPSPFGQEEIRNELYYATTYNSGVSLSNPLAQFNGIELTQLMLDNATSQSDWKTADSISNGFNSGYYPAACCCWRYNTDGTSNGDWYLPAVGELGYMVARANAINAAIATIQSIWGVGFVLISYSYWSNLEYDNYYAWRLSITDGCVYYSGKLNDSYVRAFCRVSFPKPDYYLTKSEADDLYQPKGDYVNTEKVEEIVEDKLSATNYAIKITNTETNESIELPLEDNEYTSLLINNLPQIGSASIHNGDEGCQVILQQANFDISDSSEEISVNIGDIYLQRTWVPSIKSLKPLIYISLVTKDAYVHKIGHIDNPDNLKSFFINNSNADNLIIEITNISIKSPKYLTKQEANETFATKEVVKEVSDKIEEVYVVEAQEDGTLITSKEECAEIQKKLDNNSNAIVCLKVGIYIYYPINRAMYAPYGGNIYYFLFNVRVNSWNPSLNISECHYYEFSLNIAPLNNIVETTLTKVESYSEYFKVGKNLEMTRDRVLNCTLDTTVFKVVESLPTQPAEGDENKIHLVKANQTEIATVAAVTANNLFDEFLYVDGKWELIGQEKIEIDLSNYITKDQANSNYYPKSEGESLNQSLSTINTTLNNVESDLANTLKSVTINTRENKYLKISTSGRVLNYIVTYKTSNASKSCILFVSQYRGDVDGVFYPNIIWLQSGFLNCYSVTSEKALYIENCDNSGYASVTILNDSAKETPVLELVDNLPDDAILNDSKVLNTNIAQTITGKKTFDNTVHTFQLGTDEGTHGISNFFYRVDETHYYKWNEGKRWYSDTITDGFRFKWGHSAQSEYVIGLIRGGDYNECLGFGIGLLDKTNYNIKPLFRISENGLYLNEKRVTDEWYGTQDEYKALGTYDDNTNYFIYEDTSAATLENKELTKVELPNTNQSQIEDAIVEEDIKEE